MRFILLIYANEGDWQSKSAAEQQAVIREHGVLDDDLRKTGQYGTSNALRPTRTATSVRIRNGKMLATDGPFAETKEQLGGFYLIDAKDMNDAIAIAARIPPSRWGTIEVRPIWEMPGA